MNAFQPVQHPVSSWRPSPTKSLYQPSQPEPTLSTSGRPAADLLTHRGQMLESVSRHESLLSDLRRHYILPGDSPVRDLLFEPRAVPQLLLEAVPHLRNHFGRDAVLGLRASADEEGLSTVYASVIWPGKLSDVVNALSRFDDDWWLKRAGQAAGYLTFTYELV